MCGIFAIVSSAGVDPVKLWLGTQRVSPRGPNDWGFANFAPTRGGLPKSYAWKFWDERPEPFAYRIGFGSRRLSVFDRSLAGRQPMRLTHSDLFIIFNGAIYNYLELRSELLADHDFCTETDTEVLLAAYSKWGTNCLSRLNGMFAFAVWDASRNKIFIARDRFGEKPLYYYQRQGQFILASELKQFFDDEHFDHSIDCSALADLFLYYLQDHDERTFFKAIRQLPPAHWMEVDAFSGQMTAPVRYWMPKVAADFDDSCDRWFEQNFRALLADAVRLRLRGDVPVGVCLSGGLDSTAICALAAGDRNSLPLTAYTMSFPGHDCDEGAAAKVFAKQVEVRHLDCSMRSEDLWEHLDRFVYFQDGPTGGASTFASSKVFELASSNGTVVILNGQGGDELFAGYNKYFFFWWQILLTGGRWLHLASSFLQYAARNGGSNWNLTDGRRYAPRFLRERLSSIWNFARPEFRQHASPAINLGHYGSLNHRLWQDLSQWSLPALLHWEDRNSMSASVEVRLPFLDHRIVEAVLATSARTKLNRGVTKYSLRKAMAQSPADVFQQTKKRGFETPARDWFAADLAKPLESMLSTDSPLTEFFDISALRNHLIAARKCQSDPLNEKDLFKIAATTLWLKRLTASRRGHEQAKSIPELFASLSR